LVVLSSLLVFAAAGCGSSKSSSGSASTGKVACTTTKPKVTVPSGAAPTKLVIKDLKPGSGPKVKAGDTITVNYVGVHFAGGKQFDASWDRNQTFPFQVGTGSVIAGWDQGLIGMQKCGQRELVIPPALAYGAQGSQDGSIRPGESLVFVVDLVSIQ
jgi:peptidylprolyl isomerase